MTLQENRKLSQGREKKENTVNKSIHMCRQVMCDETSAPNLQSKGEEKKEFEDKDKEEGRDGKKRGGWQYRKQFKTSTTASR